MIVAPHPAGAVAVLQADHAAMCVELADAWAASGDGATAADVRLAAEQHEAGWVELDAAPRLNADTGWPFGVSELPFRHYLDGQVVGPRRLGERSAYAGLVVSMKHAGMYRRPSVRGVLRSDGRRLRAFFAQTVLLQSELAARAGVEIGDARTVRDAMLVRCWDGLSHDLLLERAPCTRRNAPVGAVDVVDLRLERRGTWSP